MDKKGLVMGLNEILRPHRFKKKSSGYWVLDSGQIIKMINLQKSSFGNYFYINWGYVLKSIPLEHEIMHIYNRLSSLDEVEQKKITEVLELDNNLTSEKRIQELKRLVMNNLLPKINKVNTEEHLLNELKNRPHLNDIPITIKKHFNLS